MKLEVVRLEGRTPVLLVEVQGKGKRQRARLRPPRQAARDDRLARGPRAVDAGDRERKALRPRRRRRRLRGVLRRSRRCAPCSEEKRAHAPHRDADRMLRGERQLRPAGVPRGAGAAHRGAGPRHRPRLGLRQLRAALGHDLAARPRERRADRRSAHRGRALGRRERRGGRKLAHRAPAPRAHRRCADRHREARRLPRADPGGARRAGEARRRGARRGDLAQVSRSCRACSRWPRTSPTSCSTARGGRCSPSPAPTACRAPANAGNVLRPKTRVGAVAAPAAHREGATAPRAS